MEGSVRMHNWFDKGLIWIASVLLLGIVVLAVGYFTGNRIAFYVGILVTLAGVFTGIQQIVVRGHIRQAKR